VPADNSDQVLDAMIYNGTGIVTDVQVIGISNLDEAAEVTRADRDNNLTQAVRLFDEVRAELKNSRTYLQTSEAQDKLRRILRLAPQHISAKLLLGLTGNTQRRRLSATASEYYTFVAVQGALPTLLDAANAKAGQSTPEAVNLGLGSLRKLRPLSDIRVQPLIDAWSEFIQAISDAEAGRASADLIDDKRHALLDVMARLDANQDMIEKMLHEGV
jgi:hypothetical protein